MEFTIQENNEWIRIFINGVLHLFLSKRRLNGMQSWKYGKKEWCIEFTYPDSSIFCSYDSEEKWKGVLSLFSNEIFPVG